MCLKGLKSRAVVCPARWSRVRDCRPGRRSGCSPTACECRSECWAWRLHHAVRGAAAGEAGLEGGKWICLDIFIDLTPGRRMTLDRLPRPLPLRQPWQRGVDRR